MRCPLPHSSWGTRGLFRAWAVADNAAVSRGLGMPWQAPAFVSPMNAQQKLRGHTVVLSRFR